MVSSSVFVARSVHEDFYREHVYFLDSRPNLYLLQMSTSVNWSRSIITFFAFGKFSHAFVRQLKETGKSTNFFLVLTNLASLIINLIQVKLAGCVRYGLILYKG